MGNVIITQLERDNDFTSCIEKIHLDLLEGIEEKLNVPMSEEFWNKMQNPNLAYLNFEGNINSSEENITYLAHSGINNFKKSEPITKFLNKVYEYKPGKERYRSSNVNRSNNVLANDLKKIIQKSRSTTAWNREVDSESKLLETFLAILDEGILELEGELLLYTFYYPCLSCSNKVVKVITELSQRFPKLNIEIWYVEEYGM
ncbi:deaminase domain-containing protein [Peribacillus frigoritolerans]|uniref:Deaminase domain-containing protein n=1 Tax=Peribacillus frigoritolerans TaxID=450367 RepID=A0AAJ1QJJ6_9BACI|nr:deaminase domain-containing protein [Peribacillus frigoritolerans]MDM5282669.1 deaminase domain-containing protein [Peribacillus frigoritolerans]